MLLRLLATAVATGVAAWLVPGIVVSGSTVSEQAVTLLGVAVVLGLVNALVKPVAEFLSGCLILLTFGLFLLVVNAAMLLLASWICAQLGIGFAVMGFVPAVVGSLLISVVSWLLSGVLGADRDRRR